MGKLLLILLVCVGYFVFYVVPEKQQPNPVIAERGQATSLSNLRVYDIKNTNFGRSLVQSPQHIIMYSLKTCGACKRKRREMSQAGIKFQERFMPHILRRGQVTELDRIAREARATSDYYRGGFPAFVINRQLVVGYPTNAQIIALSKN